MADLTDVEVDAALHRGRVLRSSEPRATNARYDRAQGRVIIDLDNDCTFTFPPRSVQGLEKASDDQISSIEILGQGYGLHWEELDVDLSLPGLMAGIFGTQTYMAQQIG
jgi:hypothetical protein